MQSLRLTTVLASLGLVACGAPLGQLDEVTDLEVDIYLAPDDVDPTAVKVSASLLSADGQCIQLDGTFAGSLNGLAPWHTELGGEHDGGGDWENPPGCTAPAVTFQVPTDQRVSVGTLTLGDSTRSVVVDLGDRLLPRSGALVSPADGVIRPGARLVFDWSSQADLGVGVARLFLDRSGEAVATLSPTVSGDQVVVEAPATLPASGEGQARLVLSDTSFDGAFAVPCDDAACSLRTSFEDVFPVSYGR